MRFREIEGCCAALRLVGCYLIVLDDVFIVLDDVHAGVDAFIANEHTRAGDQLSDLVLALAAKRAVKGISRMRIAGFGHRHSVRSNAPYRDGGSRRR